MRDRILVVADVVQVLRECGYVLHRADGGLLVFRSTTTAQLPTVSFDVGDGIEEALFCETATMQGLDQAVLFAALEQL